MAHAELQRYFSTTQIPSCPSKAPYLFQPNPPLSLLPGLSSHCLPKAFLSGGNTRSQRSVPSIIRNPIFSARLMLAWFAAVACMRVVIHNGPSFIENRKQEDLVRTKRSCIRGATIFMKQITIIALSSVAPKVHLLLYPLRFALVEVLLRSGRKQIQQCLRCLCQSDSSCTQSISCYAEHKVRFLSPNSISLEKRPGSLWMSSIFSLVLLH